YEGWGLGLSISKSLVELMNGKIGVESDTGKGSIFWFSVKFARLKNTESIGSSLYASLYNKVAICHTNSVLCYALSQYLTALKVGKIVQTTSLESISSPGSYVVITDKHGFEKALTMGFMKILLMQTRNDESKLSMETVSVLKQPIKLNSLMESLCGRRRSTMTGTASENIKIMSKLRKISVLIVEDNPVIQKLIHNLLIKNGLSNVYCVSNGLEAVQR